MNQIHSNKIYVTKFYGYYVRDRIEFALDDWLRKNIQGEYRITDKDIAGATMTISLTVRFDHRQDANKFASMRIPVDLFREKWKRRARNL